MSLRDDYTIARWHEVDKIAREGVIWHPATEWEPETFEPLPSEAVEALRWTLRALTEAQQVIALALAGVSWGDLDSDGKGGKFEDRARRAIGNRT